MPTLPDDVIATLSWEPAPASFEVPLPSRFDLLVLNGAPLELAGRVAVQGVLVFDDDPPARVRWLADTRKIYADERYRIDRAHADVAVDDAIVTARLADLARNSRALGRAEVTGTARGSVRRCNGSCGSGGRRTRLQTPRRSCRRTCEARPGLGSRRRTQVLPLSA